MSNNLDQLTSIIHALIGMEFEQTIRPDEWPDELRPTVRALAALGATLKIVCRRIRGRALRHTGAPGAALDRCGHHRHKPRRPEALGPAWKASPY